MVYDLICATTFVKVHLPFCSRDALRQDISDMEAEDLLGRQAAQTRRLRAPVPLALIGVWNDEVISRNSPQLMAVKSNCPALHRNAGSAENHTGP